MKRLYPAACVVLALVLVPMAALAEPAAADVTMPEAVVYDAESALALFRSLAGDWDADSPDRQHGSYPAANFRVVAAGSTVIETVLQGQENEMESVFHIDGDNLLLTHYCALQNAPVLRFEPTEEPGLVKFVFHGGTNFDPAVDAHFHAGTFKVIDADTVESTFIVHAGGEAQPEGRSVLKRRTE
ncbi:MAG: hypothetical protein VYE73_07840 [Acidobacteriota bacterium]|nr:hypothetical protein [Acidobacteriota bacterium]